MKKKIAILVLMLCEAAFGARTFNGTNQYFKRMSSFSEITDYPFTYAAWVNSDVNNADDWILQLGKTEVESIFYDLQIDDTAGAIKQHASNTTARTSATTTYLPISEWHHVCAVFTSATSRDVYLDASGKGSSAISVTYNIDVNEIWLGARYTSVPINFLDGSLAEVGIWDRALTLDDVNDLYINKYAPSLVQDANLIAYWRLNEQTATDDATDQQGNYTLTQYNSPTYTDHSSIGIVYSLGGAGGTAVLGKNGFRVLGGGVVK